MRMEVAVMGQRNFRKFEEDFSCSFCGTVVKGSGYTNHCPNCLWSTHVDKNPGDRAERCGGLMKPLSVVYNRDYHTITHKCLKCGTTKRVKAAPSDNHDILSQRLKAGPLVI